MIPSRMDEIMQHWYVHKAGLKGFRAVFLLWALLSVPLLFSGILPAVQGQEQKREEDSAREGRDVSEDEPFLGMDTLTDLLEEQKISIEFVRKIESKLEDIRQRERELEQREKALALVQQDIERKLRRLEVAREKLESLTRKVDEDREEELSLAVRKYKAMDAEMAAKFFNQMDLEFVAPVLKRLDTQTGGKILDAMVRDAQTGEDSDQKMRKLKELGEYIVDPQLVESMRSGMDSAAAPTPATP